MTHPARKDFNRTTLSALRKKGIFVVAKTALPGPDGSFLQDGGDAYVLDDNGTARVRTFRDVLSLAN